MTSEEIIKAVDYKKGHFNMVQYLLAKGLSVSVYDRETDDFVLDKSNKYEDIKELIKDYETEIDIYNDEHKVGWALFIPQNDSDEDIVADYLDTITLRDWSEQFEKLHEELNK